MDYKEKYEMALEGIQEIRTTGRRQESLHHSPTRRRPCANVRESSVP